MIMESHDSLPCMFSHEIVPLETLALTKKIDIDPDISEYQRTAAYRLISRELPQDRATLHPSIAETPTSRLTPALQREVARAGTGQPLTGGINLSRYESFNEVSADTDTETLKAALRLAYTNVSYLRGRQMNIALLEEYGKHAWLIGNSHLEDVQKRLDAELTRTKELSEETNRARKLAQEDSKGQLLGLEETWKQGIGRIIETQIATDALRRESAVK